MADIRPVDADFAVAPQIQPEELAALAGRFSTVINNRLDDEEPGQPASAALAAAAAEAGLTYVHIPIVGRPTADQVRAVQAATAESSGPVLAFCRTGTRSIVTWAAGEALGGRAVEDLVAAGERAGYDLRPPLQAMPPRPRE